MSARIDIRRVGILAVLVVCFLGLGAAGCDATMGRADSDENGADYYDDEQLVEALRYMSEHRVDDARREYEEIIAGGRTPGEAYAGKALTDLMLLASSEPVTTLVVEHLGADSGIDANEAIFADEGLLFWMARGVPWHDDGEFSGISSLIAHDVPWSAEELASLHTFFDGLDSHADQVADDLVEVNRTLADIETNLQRAINASDFDVFVLPGRTFHDRGLDMTLARGELHLLAGIVAGLRGAIFMTGAYEHDWTLESAFVWELDEEEYESWTALDRALDFLDRRIGRAIRKAARLEAARDAFDDGLGHLIAAIEVGTDERVESTLDWRAADPQYVQQLVAFLEAARHALHTPTDLPHTSPETRLDLTSFFDPGRTLDADYLWFERVEIDSGATWQLTDGAWRSFFVEGVFEPSFEVRENAPDTPLTGDRADEFERVVFGQFLKAVENAYFTTR